MGNFIIVIILFVSSFPAAAQNFDSVNIKTTKVAGSVYMLEGSGGNIGVLIGNDGIILIDDQYAPLAEKSKKHLLQSVINRLSLLSILISTEIIPTATSRLLVTVLFL